MARMVSGMALMGTAAMLFANGDLVGKRSPAEEQDGIKSYSIRPRGPLVSIQHPVAGRGNDRHYGRPLSDHA